MMTPDGPKHPPDREESDFDLSGRVIGAALEVHRHLGPGLLESIYRAALAHELLLRGISFEQEKEIDVSYKEVLIKGQRVDLVVEERLIVEVKSVRTVADAVLAQVLSYLHASKLRHALLINFGERLLKDGIRRISV
jgi:GxxExxY protein